MAVEDGAVHERGGGHPAIVPSGGLALRLGLSLIESASGSRAGRGGAWSAQVPDTDRESGEREGEGRSCDGEEDVDPEAQGVGVVEDHGGLLMSGVHL
jgi:hypothetical protein